MSQNTETQSLKNAVVFNQQTEVVACPVCKQDQPQAVLRAKEHLVGSEHWFDVVRCGKCGLLYTSPRPTVETIGQYYSGGYYSDLAGTTKAGKVRFKERVLRATMRHHYGYPGPKNLLLKLLTLPMAWRMRHSRRYISDIPWAGSGRLLDFGCGRGGFLLKQQQRGWQVWGIDFSEEQAKSNREKGLDVVAGTWPGDPLADRTFDVITGWHVLEHLPDPPGWARQAARQLAPGGYLLVACPVSDSWTYRLFGANWYALDVPRHFSHFTKPQLAQLLTDAGLKVERIRPQVMVQTWQESARRQAAATGSTASKILVKCRWLCSLLARLAAVCGAGDSAVIIARKPQ